ILRRHEADRVHFIAQERVGHRLPGKDGFEVVRFGHPLEQLNGRKSARDDPPACLPVDPGDWRRHAQPPRWASRYCRTTKRSATWPDSIRWSADFPAKREVWFGRLIQASAAASS